MSGIAFVAMANGFTQHPKVMDLHDRAFRFHVAALDYCSTNLTDGHVSAKGVKVVAAIVNTQPKRWVAELVAAKLWKHDPTGDGFWINDFLVYNPTAEAVKELRDKRRQAGIRGAEKRWRGGDAKPTTPDSKPDGKSHDTGHSKSHSNPHIPAEQKQELELDMSSGRHFNNDLPETIDPENEFLVARLMHLIGDHADTGTRLVVASKAARLPASSIAKVIESVQSNQPANRAGYAVKALDGELEERNAA